MAFCMNIQQAIYEIVRVNRGKVYNWEEGRCCTALVREYVDLTTGHIAHRHHAEDENERRAYRSIVKAKGCIPLYDSWLSGIKTIKKKEVSDMTIGDIAVVGCPGLHLYSTKNTVYKCTKYKSLMGIVDTSGSLLHWSDCGLTTMHSDWIPHAKVVYGLEVN